MNGFAAQIDDWYEISAIEVLFDFQSYRDTEVNYGKVYNSEWESAWSEEITLESHVGTPPIDENLIKQLLLESEFQPPDNPPTSRLYAFWPIIPVGIVLLAAAIAIPLYIRKRRT